MSNFVPHYEYFCIHCHTILKYTEIDNTLQIEPCSIHSGDSVYQILIQNEELSNHYRDLKNALQ